MVSAIAGYGRIQNIYAYHSAHFNQVQNSPVAPVQRAGRVPGISDDDDRLNFAATYQPEQEQRGKIELDAIEKQTQKLRNSFGSGQKLQYQLSNPYEASRMSLDNMLVAGMNFDMMA